VRGPAGMGPGEAGYQKGYRQMRWPCSTHPNRHSGVNIRVNVRCSPKADACPADVMD